MITEGVRVEETAQSIAATERGGLPSGLRLLCVSRTEPSWVSLTLKLDSRGSSEPRFRWASTPGEALTILAEESFDCILFRYHPVWDREGEDPLGLARAVRAGGSADPIIVVTQAAGDDAWSEAIAIDVELLVTPRGWESTALIPAIARAIARGQLQADFGRLAAAERSRLLRDQGESEALLRQQHQIAETEIPSPQRAEAQQAGAGAACRISPGDEYPELEAYYHDLLRGYVLMSSGSLTVELKKLAEVLAGAGYNSRQLLRLHLRHLSQLIAGLGNRSSRHVLGRANLLVLEMLVLLGEVNRGQSLAPELLEGSRGP